MVVSTSKALQYGCYPNRQSLARAFRIDFPVKGTDVGNNPIVRIADESRLTSRGVNYGRDAKQDD